jgi:hypothetical protein
MAKRKIDKGVRNVIVVSDLHCGCRLGLCSSAGADLDDGGLYVPPPTMRKVWSWWREFWADWVPAVTRGEPYAVVVNGDVLDGVHHASTTQISQNLTDQARIAEAVLRPIVGACDGRFYMVRGTEAHVGKSAAEEEALAAKLGAIPNEAGQYARWDLWFRVGDRLAHFLHHIGATGSNAYEATALMKEWTEAQNEAARWGEPPPDVIVRSHRHRCCEVRVPTSRGHGIAIVTAGWQLKTPFAWKLPGARLAPPQIGGALIRLGRSGDFYALPWVRHVGRSGEVNA